MIEFDPKNIFPCGGEGDYIEKRNVSGGWCSKANVYVLPPPTPTQIPDTQDYKFQAAFRHPHWPPGGVPVSLRGKWKLRGGAAVEGPPAAAPAALVTPRRLLRGTTTAAMPMKGRFPIRRTLQYLGQGDVVFKDTVKVMTVNYNTHGKLGEGARSVQAL